MSDQGGDGTRISPIEESTAIHPEGSRQGQIEQYPSLFLSVSPSKAVVATKELGNAVKWPQNMVAPADKQDKNKWCELHADHDH